MSNNKKNIYFLVFPAYPALLTLQEAGFKSPPWRKIAFFAPFCDPIDPEKFWRFPNIYDNASHILLEAQNGLKWVSIGKPPKKK